MRVRPFTIKIKIFLSSFNSRTREGATISGKNLTVFDSFNSRTREGATRLERQDKGLYRVSIHAPVRVRHKGINIKEVYDEVSIHAPVRVRRLLFLFLLYNRSFNSRTREGATFPESSFS